MTIRKYWHCNFSIHFTCIDYFLFCSFTSLLSIIIRRHVTHPVESGVALPLYGECDATD